MANLRRDRARRSYRSMAASTGAASDRTIASLARVGGPCWSRSLSAGRSALRRSGFGGYQGMWDRPGAIRSRRASRARTRSICGSAILRASSRRIWLGAMPAISRAKASASEASAEMDQTGTANPCRRAFCDDRALPAADLGPVLARAFLRLAAILRAVLIAVRRRRFMLDASKLDIVLLVYRLRDVACFVALGFAVGTVAPRLHHHNHTVHALC